MDPSAQDTTQLPQQQARPVAEPVVRDPLAQPQPVAPQAPSSPKTAISVGTEMGRFQITDEEEDDDKGSSQGYTPLQAQTPSEIIHEPTKEKAVTQAAPPAEIVQSSSERIVAQSIPQEVAQQPMDVIQPAVPEVVVPKEIGHLVQKAPIANNPFLPPELQNMGVKHTIPQVVVPQNSLGIKELPLPYEEAIAKEKAFRPQDAGKWLAAKVHYYWRKINPVAYK
jgi:hypothetical protein